MLERLRKLSFFYNRSKFTRLAIVLIIIFSIFLTAIFAQKQQELRQQAAGSTQFGVQVDLNKSIDSNQVQNLRPAWARFVYRPGKSVPNLGIQNLVMINHESIGGIFPPLNNQDYNTWKNWIDNTYLPGLQTIINNHSFSAIQIWNEEDICPIPPDPDHPEKPSYCPKVPLQAYAYMLKNAASIIKNKNSNTKVVMGGLAKGDVIYLNDVKNADSTTFNQVDAVGIHPYGKSPDGWRTDVFGTGDLRSIISNYRSSSPKEIWISEIGEGMDDRSLQAEYEQRIFNIFKDMNIPVAIWYAMSDLTAGGNGMNNWGLYDASSNIKPSGTTFCTFTGGCNGQGITNTPTPSSYPGCNLNCIYSEDHGSGVHCHRGHSDSCNNPDDCLNQNCLWVASCTPNDPIQCPSGATPIPTPIPTTPTPAGTNCQNELILGINGEYTHNDLLSQLFTQNSIKQMAVSWKEIQPNRDSPLNFNSVQEKINFALSEGLTPAIVFCDGDCFPDWARQADSKTANCCTNPYVCRNLTEDSTTINAFNHIVQELAKTFKDQVKYWGFGIEPNCRGETPAVYTNWLQRFTDAIRNNDPGSVIIGGHLAGANTDYLRSMYDNGAKNYFDRIAIDPYGQPLDPRIDDIRNLMVEKGDSSKKVWVSEWGIQSGNNETGQASLIKQGIESLMSKSWIEAAFYHDYECELWDTTCYFGSPAYIGYGLLKGDGTPKQSYYTFKSFSDSCNGSTPPTTTPGNNAPPCDASQLNMSVNPNPANLGNTITFNLSGTQGSTYINDSWSGGVNCSGNFWGTKQCIATGVGSFKWTHKWKNCAPDNCNITSSECSKDYTFEIKEAPVPTQCPTLGKPLNVTYSCDTTRNRATLRWDPGNNAQFYSVRLDDLSNPWNNSCSNLNPEDQCANPIQTSYTFEGINTSHNFNFWVHSRSNCVSGSNNGWSESVYSIFNCNNTLTPTLSPTQTPIPTSNPNATPTPTPWKWIPVPCVEITSNWSLQIGCIKFVTPTPQR